MESFILILTLLNPLSYGGSAVTTATFNTAKACNEAAARWIKSIGRTGYVKASAVCVRTGPSS